MALITESGAMSCKGMFLKLATLPLGNQTDTPHMLNRCLTLQQEHHQYNLELGQIGTDIYSYATPFIFTIGFLGNMFSLKVFTSKFMRLFSSSCYLMCLSLSDTFVLIFYVLLEWLDRGLEHWPQGLRVGLIHYNGVCQLFLYMSYVFRFTSVYLILMLSVERYVLLYCKRYRKHFSKMKFARRAIGLLLGTAMLLSIYKPVLSGVHQTEGTEGESIDVCTSSPNYEQANFILDNTYAVLITAVPFVLTIIFSLPILLKVFTWRRESLNDRLAFRQTQIRLEFTFIQLGLSCCFICLTVPYFVIWSLQFWEHMQPTSVTNTDKLNGLGLITRTLFYLNYSCKFFLYCITGAYYRREISSMLFYYRSSWRNSQKDSSRGDRQTALVML